LAGSDERGLHVVTIWDSQAHADRFGAEQLFPAFQALGLMSEVVLDRSREPAPDRAMRIHVCGAVQEHHAAVHQNPPVRRGCIAPPPMCRVGYGLASYTTLISVSLARRKRVRPAWVTTSRILASPAWPPSASPTSCDSDAGVHSRVEKP